MACPRSLAKGAGAEVTVVERSSAIGGLARTIAFEGNRFDVGPHRFFTKNREIRALFEETVADDGVTVSRLTRILHAGRFFDYFLMATGELSDAQIDRLVLERIAVLPEPAAGEARPLRLVLKLKDGREIELKTNTLAPANPAARAAMKAARGVERVI